MDDPSRDWDVLCAERESEYMERIAGRTCMDCANCEQPEEPYAGQIGWCRMSDAFVYEGDTPKDMDCGAFE